MGTTADLKPVQVRLEPKAYDKIAKLAAKNKRGMGPEIAMRIEAELRGEKAA